MPIYLVAVEMSRAFWYIFMQENGARYVEWLHTSEQESIYVRKVWSNIIALFLL